uniref:Uncharacterized protein n=1 Tax=viral metagenome TaxID=1070528 RepID=A0A6C0AKQ9_9ZZZZ
MTTLLALHVTRTSEQSADDIILFQTDPAYPDVVEITSTFSGTKKLRYQYTLPRSRCSHYARTIVRALVDDVEPFDRVQISSAMFPAVMYNVEDLVRSRVMESIDEVLHLTFDCIVHRSS